MGKVRCHCNPSAPQVHTDGLMQNGACPDVSDDVVPSQVVLQMLLLQGHKVLSGIISKIKKLNI